MKLFVSLIIIGLLPILASSQPLRVLNLTAEYKTNPLGIGNAQPELSWQLFSGKRNVMQQAYEVRVAEDSVRLKDGKSLLWSTGKVNSDQALHVRYDGKKLKSRQRCFWQVRVWSTSGDTSDWSAVNYWEMGLLTSADWHASWIEPLSDNSETNMRPSPLLRKPFAVAKPVRSARLYVTAFGLYEVFINGKRVSNAYLTPGWTSYEHRLQYQVYDVTSLIYGGDNVVGAALGDGWYRGKIGFNPQANLYGKNVALLLELEITYTDGTSREVITDNTWNSSTGPVLSNGIYSGEVYDARLESEWSTAGFNPSGWKGVRVADRGKDQLVATQGPLVRPHEVFKPVAIFTTPEGDTVADFGQNLVGHVTLKVNGKAGDTIKLWHAEVLDKAGNFYTDNLRSAAQEITYILKGGGQEVYTPHFTFMGFRYVKVEGIPGKLTADNLTATALYSDMEATGTFLCSDDLLNRLQHNIQWGQKGNFLDVPTDCPQRDERLGWTGDAQAFSSTAAYNMDVAGFFLKWLKDLAADQNEDGGVPFVIPNVLGPRAASSTGWADVSTIIPWNMYEAYGDKRFLAEQYESMKAWVGYMESKMNDDYLWNTGFHFGDWLFYSPDDDNSGRAAITDRYLIAQAFFIHSTDILARSAGVLGKTDDATRYRQLAAKLREAFNKEYVTPSGRLVSSTQTAYVLALKFDLLPEHLREQAADRLVQNVHNYDDHLTTGFLGTPFLCDVLNQFGHSDVAYTLLQQKTYPSWLYPVTMGATTIWERWDGIKPDSTFETPSMNSFNHYAYGAIGDWMYKVMAGISAEKPGYKVVRLAPTPGGTITSAKGTLDTPYGEVSSSWSIHDGQFIFEVRVPPNTTAHVVLPGAAGKEVHEGGNGLALTEGLTGQESVGTDLSFRIGSGHYTFSYNW